MIRYGQFGRRPAWTSVGAAALLALGAPAYAASLPEGGPVTGFPATGVEVALPAPPDVECLAQAIYYEAGGEVRAGREAVAQVVLNRLHSPAYPKTVCGVVFQGAARATGCQFTFTCDGSRGRRPDARGWSDAQAIARDALAGRLVSPVGGSTHYHATWMRPGWSRTMTPTLRIGGHQFYVSGAPAHGSALISDAAAEPKPQAVSFSVWGLQVATIVPKAGGLTTIPAP